MRKLLNLFILFIPFLSSGQNPVDEILPVEDSLVKYSEVINVDSSLSSNDLYLKAKTWIADGLESNNIDIQIDEKPNLIILKSYLRIHSDLYDKLTKVWFKTKLEMKDTKYRYSIYGIQFDLGYGAAIITTPFMEWAYSLEEDSYESLSRYCKKIDKVFEKNITSLKDEMKKSGDDSW
jgi:hypothetical protein